MHTCMCIGIKKGAVLLLTSSIILFIHHIKVLHTIIWRGFYYPLVIVFNAKHLLLIVNRKEIIYL